jgi:hypothetical protein
VDALKTPYAAPLKDAVARGYELFSPYKIASTLETCACPVCMTEDLRLEIIATPIADMPQELIQQYSNSAHGVAQNLDDMKAILPRYLDLMAQDEEVDFTGVGTELHRFGDAVRAGGFLSADETALYHDWARLMILHFGWAEAQEYENLACPSYLLELLSCGGVAVEVLLGALEELFDLPEIGAVAFGQFCNDLTHSLRHRAPRVGVDLYAMGYAAASDRQAVADWLNSVPFMARIMDAADAQPSSETSLAVQIMFDLHGRFDATAFPDHSKTR